MNGPSERPSLTVNRISLPRIEENDLSFRRRVEANLRLLVLEQQVREQTSVIKALKATVAELQKLVRDL